MIPKVTTEQLLQQYADNDWRQRFLELSDVRRLLRDCILGEKYVLPDGFNNALVLTPEGQEFMQKLIRRHGINPKVARVRTFLTMTHSDLLIDVEKTDLALLRKTVDSQVLEKRIIIPMPFGRELYDRAAQEFEEEIPFLSHSETVKILKDVSIGYAQLGSYITGPFGYIESRQKRWYEPEKDLPLYHCSKITCDTVHVTHLSTDPEAEINKSAEPLRQILEPHRKNDTAWIEFEREISIDQNTYYDDSAQTALPLLLAECLSDRELKSLLAHLLDHTSGALRRALPGTAGTCTEAAKFVQALTWSQALQLTLLCTDEEIINGIESLIAPGADNDPPAQKDSAAQIIVPQEEVRRPRVSRDLCFGQFQLQPELSALGVRFKARYGISHLRLHRLIDKMYPRTLEHQQEFDWQFRSSGATARDAQQDEVLRLLSPREVVERIIMSRHDNVATAIETLGIPEITKGDDTRLIDTILWKLGYPLDSEVDENMEFWSEHAHMTAISQTATASAHQDRNSIRGAASNYFREVEHVLDDSLAFSTWLLLADHLKSPQPFIYRSTTDHSWAMEHLNQLDKVTGQGNPDNQRFSNRNTLSPLIQGHSILADHLQAIQDAADRELRPHAELPVAKGGSTLKRYPFTHFKLFFDLTRESQDSIINTLRETSRKLATVDVAGVRNSWVHYRREEASVDDLVNCLRATQDAIQGLESAGLSRLLYRPISTISDPGERTLTTLQTTRGRTISIAGPSRLDLSGLPSLNEPQYLVTTALLPNSRDIVRIGLQPESQYTAHWNIFPRRRREATQVLSATNSESHSAPMENNSGGSLFQ